MPAAIKLRIVSARDLPVMDSPTDSTDAYVEVCFADTPHLRTRVEKRTLNPTWNQEFRIEVADDCDLQDCPLVLKCIDKDYMTSDDEIGAVCIDLNPLLYEHEHVQLAGWFPLYDTLRGACGELSIVVKMDFVGDVNPFKESGAGVQFLSVERVPARALLLAWLVVEGLRVQCPQLGSRTIQSLRARHALHLHPGELLGSRSAGASAVTAVKVA